MDSKNIEIVVPGEKICVIEEFLPGSYTYSDDDGYVKSLIVGKVIRDFKKYEVHVEPIKNRIYLRQGDIILGKVIGIISEKVAIIKILSVFKNGTYVELRNWYTGLLHISQASETYLQSIHEVLGIGDIIRAKIISSKGPPYLLSIRSSNLGVIYTLCPVCRIEMRRKLNTYQCVKCGLQVKKKVPISD